MSTPSNLYAEKIFSEHPLALWALDDQADYISLISEANRDIEDVWNITNATAFSAINDPSDPFPTSSKTLIKADVPSLITDETVLISPNLVNFQNLNLSLGTFCIGAYFNFTSVYPSELKFGYEYTDPDTLEIIQELRSYVYIPLQKWSFISETFEIPNIDAEFRTVIKISFFPSGGTIDDYAVSFNGVTVGQWAEEFNASSLGLDTSVLPTQIALSSSDVIEAKQYGLGGQSGYYFVYNNSILAKNSGVPLVFGASNITKLVPNTNDQPSFIIPGYGFLNQSGKYNDYTVEFWIKTNCTSSTPIRIFGPIASSDGIYLDSGFLTLSIGSNSKSHFIGEWNRPMLIQIRLIKDSASLLINGEEVISLNFITSDLILPSILNELDKEQDWLGFYTSPETSPMEIDCIAIYSYNIPTIVAKRRWVYGQAVLSPEKIDSAYNGSSAFIDYTFADYTANYSYPNFAKWEQATFDNLTTTQTSLTVPGYTLPNLFLGTKTINDLYNDCKIIQTEDYPFITFKPNPSWDDVNSYINFTKFGILNDEVHTLYGVFQINEDDESEQILFKIYNTLTNDSFDIRKDAQSIHYYLTYNGIEEEIYTTSSFIIGQPFSVGIALDKLSSSFAGNISAFFGNKNGLKVYVGGDETGLKTFTGYIYSIGFSTNHNANDLSEHFQDNGIAELTSGIQLINHTASYTLLPTNTYDQFYLDIGSSSYWEDYMPLSYFGQYVKNDIGNDVYNLDLLQFNIGYPSTTKTTVIDDIKYFNTNEEIIRSYITFQYISDGANLTQDNFTTTALAKENKIIDLNEYTSWSTTKFEIVDGTILYPPKDINFNNLAIVYSIEINNRAILNKPVNLKRLEIASQVFNNNSFNPIGTRFGINLFPYKKTGIYYDYKSKNPYSIYKGSTPYLYLTKNSGIEIKKNESDTSERGIAIPINSTNASQYKISAIQLWLMNNHSIFSETPEKLFTLDYKDDVIIFYVVANSGLGTRGKIYAKRQSNGEIFNGLAFYLNGNLVKDPVITVSEWNVLGVTFLNSLNFNNYLGKITLNAPFIFNNIAYYQASSIQEIQSKITRPWFRVKQNGPIYFDWQYWSNFNWENVLVLGSTDAYGINPSNIYNTYTGTNKIIIDDGKGMTFDAEKIKIHTSINWSSIVQTPV